MSRSHRLQGELYAKALGFDTFGVCYVASDDYRTLCFEETVGDEVDAVIDRYEAQVKLGSVPVFESDEKWQTMKLYNPYYEWMRLNEGEIMVRLLDKK